MTTLENKPEISDLNNEVEIDLGLIDANSSFSATEALLAKEDNEVQLESMKESRNVVESIFNKVDALYFLELKLNEPSEYREKLRTIVREYKGRLNKMNKLIDLYDQGLETGQNFDKKKVKANAEEFARYATEAKSVELELKDMEREIKSLKRDQDMDNRMTEMEEDNQRRDAELRKREEELRRREEELKKREEELEEAKENKIIKKPLKKKNPADDM